MEPSSSELEIELLRERIDAYQPKTIDPDVDLPAAAVLVPVRPTDNGPEIVLTLRASHLKTHKGQVAFPGGKYDEEDQTLLRTALRESHEEVDLKPSQVEVIGSLSEVISLHGIRVTPYVGLIDNDIDLRPNYDELDSIFYVNVQKIINSTPKRRDRMTYKGVALSVPSYDYEYEGKNYEIWGLSAIILVELLNLAFDANITIYDES